MMRRSTRLEVYADGACSGNPGEAGIGVVIKQDGKVIKTLSRSLGLATNNIAEYTAVIDALKEAIRQSSREIILFTDSELVYNQLIGQFKINNENIKPLFEQIKILLKGFKRVEIQRIPREQNKEADQLAKKAIKKEQAKVVTPPYILVGGEESPSSRG